jgi:hypothetical protein
LSKNLIDNRSELRHDNTLTAGEVRERIGFRGIQQVIALRQMKPSSSRSRGCADHVPERKKNGGKPLAARTAKKFRHNSCSPLAE